MRLVIKLKANKTTAKTKEELIHRITCHLNFIQSNSGTHYKTRDEKYIVAYNIQKVRTKVMRTKHEHKRKPGKFYYTYEVKELKHWSANVYYIPANTPIKVTQHEKYFNYSYKRIP